MHAAATSAARSSSSLICSHLRIPLGRSSARLKCSGKTARCARTFSTSNRSHQSHLISNTSLCATSLSHSTPSFPPRRPSIPHVAYYRAWDRPRTEYLPPCSEDEAARYLWTLLPPLEFPNKAVRQIITHPSWKAGFEGHNNRLAFLGRRVMNAYLVLFLDDAGVKVRQESHTLEQPDYQTMVETILDSSPLGKYVGGNWNVDRVMRWISNMPTGDDRRNDWVGRNAARATVVEAIMGGVLHQYGASIAHRTFHTRLLPFLKPMLPEHLHSRVDEICEELGGPRASLVSDSNNAKPKAAVTAQQPTPAPTTTTQSSSLVRTSTGRLASTRLPPRADSPPPLQRRAAMMH